MCPLGTVTSIQLYTFISKKYLRWHIGRKIKKGFRRGINCQFSSASDSAASKKLKAKTSLTRYRFLKILFSILKNYFFQVSCILVNHLLLFAADIELGNDFCFCPSKVFIHHFQDKYLMYGLKCFLLSHFVSFVLFFFFTILFCCSYVFLRPLFLLLPYYSAAHMPC